MDFITGLPETARGYQHLLVIVDRLSKGTVLVPLRNLESETLARVFVKHYFAHHGLPKSIVSDRGEQFVRGVWSFIYKIIRIKQRLSTAYHPETDGQTERINQVIEEFVRHFCRYKQDN